MNPNPMKAHALPSRGGTPAQQGFSLIELMIAITLGLLIMAGMLVVFANTSATRNEIDRTNRQIENGRYAMELLRDDVQLAGFFGEIDIASLTYAGALPDLCSTTLLERTWPAGGTPGLLLMHTQGINDFDASLSTALDSCPTIKSAVKTGTDVILVRRVKTCFAGAGCDTLAALAGKPVMQISFCTAPTVPSASTIKTHALALLGTAGEFVHMNNSAVGTLCTVTAALRPYVIYLYFVGTYNGKDNVLMRAQLRLNGTATDMTDVTPLVDGIDNMQLDYGVDTTGDGNADVYFPSVALPVMAVADWQNVVSVKINLLARNTEVSQDYKGSALEAAKTYNLGPSAGSIGPFTDGFRRHVYSSVVRIQNISGRREKP